MTEEITIAAKPPVSTPNKWMVLLTVAFGTFMATLDGSIVNIALPTIRRQLNAGDNVEWIVLSTKNAVFSIIGMSYIVHLTSYITLYVA